MSAPAWAGAIYANAAEPSSARRLVSELVSLEQAALAFCRLLERWARGDAEPPTADRRRAALQHSAGSVAEALGRLERPLERYLLELEPEAAEGRAWFASAGQAELVDWAPVLTRAGVAVPAHTVAAAYLELAVLIRALEGLSAAVGLDAGPDRGSLWAGLFDLGDNLLGPARAELALLAA